MTQEHKKGRIINTYKVRQPRITLLVRNANKQPCTVHLNANLAVLTINQGNTQNQRLSVKAKNGMDLTLVLRI